MRILIVSHGLTGESMAGPGALGRALAGSLRKGFEVLLVAPGQAASRRAGFRLEGREPDDGLPSGIKPTAMPGVRPC